MQKYTIFSFSLLVYAAFSGVFLYLIAFVGNFVVPKTINAPATTTPTALALLTNIALIITFGVAHSAFARRKFKQWWTRFVPISAERTLYVLQAITLLALLMWQWEPLPTVIWSAENELLRLLLWGIFWLGWMLVLLSSFLINHFELVGLQQAWRGTPADSHFVTPLLYKWVRHPMMVGFLLAFWAIPTMTAGHLLFAGGMTLYIIIGIHFEERDLVAHFGETYRNYQQRIPKLLPFTRRPQKTKEASV